MRPAGSLCRHKGIGMNKPKKTKVEVVKYVRVMVLLRGVACEHEPEPEPEPPQEVAPPVPASPYDLDIFFAKGMVSDYEWYGRRLKAILAKVR